MRDDKEFKAKKRDESYIKNKSPDIQLGRHGDIPERQPPSQSKKNRIYQARQEQKPKTAEADYTEPDMPDTPDIPDTQEYSPEPQQEEFSEAAESLQSENAQNIPKAEPTQQAQKANQTKRKLYRTQAKASQKSVKTDFVRAADNAEKSEAPEPQTQSKTDDYNIREAVQSKEQEFTYNSNPNFSETAADRDANVPFERVKTSDTAEDGAASKDKRKNQTYQKSARQPDASDTSGKESKDAKTEQATDGGKKSEQEPSADVPFDRVTRFEQKAEKARAKANKAEQKLPQKKKIKRQRLYDEQKQKVKSRLQFEKEVKPMADLYHRSPLKNSVDTLQYAAVNKLHQKIAEAESDNTAVEAAHKAEQQAERLTAYSMRTAKYINGQRKAAPYKKAARLQQRAERAEVKALYEKTLAEHPELKKSQVKKFLQKQQIKKQYQKAKRAEQTAKQAKRAAQNAEKAASRTVAFVWRHKVFFGIVIGIGLLIAWLGSVLSSCSVMLTTGTNSLMVSSYFAEDADIYAAENYYVGLEQGLQNKVDRVETNYPGYDEYRYNVAGIGHNPYELISYLTAVYQDFQFNDIQSGLDELCNVQYHLTITETTEQRTDDAGNTYDYKVLNVTLTNGGFTTGLTDDQRELYDIYLASKGNRDYLFANDIYANESVPPSYTIPGEALSDETFRRLITEAEKYLGFPYVWGGSSPSTSFDCSGFVCWVFQNSGVYPLSRTTAQGIYNQCAVISPQDAKPGDIIFFKGTYNTSEVSHVGIYVGNGMMIHCGSPIQYANVNTSYWQQHFFAYGRLGGN